jgi:hypothetical protein
MISRLYDGPLPILPVIRRVPTRYHHILPLPFMKHLQCIVIGEGPGVLTVAISDARKVEVIASLEALMGRRIFAVLVDPSTMSLLISRLERCERKSYTEEIRRPCYLHQLQLHAFIHFLRDQHP